MITQIPQAQQIIPAETNTSNDKGENSLSYEFEPEEDEILEDLLPKIFQLRYSKLFGKRCKRARL